MINSFNKIYKFLFTIIIIIAINLNLSEANIIYNKNGTLITEYEVQTYIENYNAIFKKEINIEQSIKNLVLINKTILYLEKNNQLYLDQLDKNLLEKYNKEIIKNEIILNILRFIEIKNDFIVNYYRNNLNLSDVEKAITISDNLSLTYSANGCLTIEGVFNYQNYSDFAKLIYENIKNLERKMVVNVNNMDYELCYGSNERTIIEESLFTVIEQNTKKEFNNFLYNAYKK